MPVNDAVCCLHLAKAIKLSPAGFISYLLSWQGNMANMANISFYNLVVTVADVDSEDHVGNSL